MRNGSPEPHVRSSVASIALRYWWLFVALLGWLVNKKLVYRLYCEEGLGIRRKKPRRRKSVLAS